METKRIAKRRNIVWGAAATAILGLIAGIPALITLVMSIKSFEPAKGLWASPWIGFSAFQTVISTPEFYQVALNSLCVAAITALLLCALGIPAVWGLRRLSSIPRRFSVAGVLFLPFLFTQPVLQMGLMPSSPEALGPPVGWLFLAAVMTLYGLPLMVLGALFVDWALPGRVGRPAVAMALGALGIAWCGAFCVGMRGLLLPSLHETRAWMTLLPDAQFTSLLFIRPVSLGNTPLPFGSAARLISGFIGKAGLLGIGVALLAVARARPREHVLVPRKDAVFAAFPAIALATAACLLTLRVFPIPSPFEFDQLRPYAMTLTYLLPPLLGAVLGWMLAQGVEAFRGKGKPWAILALCVVLVSMGGISIGRYFLHRMAFPDAMPELECGTYALLSMLAVLLLRRGRGKAVVSREAMLLAGLALLTFAVTAGDPTAAMAHISRVEQFPYSLLERSLLGETGLRKLLLVDIPGVPLGQAASLKPIAYTLTMLCSIAGGVCLIIKAIGNRGKSPDDVAQADCEERPEVPDEVAQ